MKRRVYLAGQAALAVAAIASADPLHELRFLSGTWNGGAPEAQGTDTFPMDLDGPILQRRSRTAVSAARGQSAGSMRALLSVHSTGEADSLPALYVDDAGHSIQYSRVTEMPGHRIEFRGDDAPLEIVISPDVLVEISGHFACLT